MPARCSSGGSRKRGFRSGSCGWSQGDGSHVVDGTVTIRDLNRQFDWELPDEEASTIAGLLIHEARVIPEVGQLYSFYNFRFEVLGRRKNRLTVIRVTPQLSTKPTTDR